MKRIAFAWIALLIAAVLFSACQSGALRKAKGSVAVEEERVAGPMPAHAPPIIYVTDFALDAEHFQSDEGVRGLLPGRLRARAASSLGSGIADPLADHDPAAKAQEIVATLSESLVKGFSEKGIPAKALNPVAGGLPGQGWMVSGVFTEVDEGSRIKRAVIGFGRGATHMDAQVMISDLSGRAPQSPFVIFGTVKDPGEIPGAVVTMNPYVAAARFVMEKNATRRDIETTADQIAQEVLKFMDQHSRGQLPAAAP